MGCNSRAWPKLRLNRGLGRLGQPSLPLPLGQAGGLFFVAWLGRKNGGDAPQAKVGIDRPLDVWLGLDVLLVDDDLAIQHSANYKLFGLFIDQ